VVPPTACGVRGEVGTVRQVYAWGRMVFRLLLVSNLCDAKGLPRRTGKKKKKLRKRGKPGRKKLPFI